MSRLSGTVTLSGSPVENATVYVVDSTNDTVAAVTTTDANGDWEATGLANSASERYHALVQYDDGTTKYNAGSLPYLSTPGLVQPGAVNLNVDSPTPSITVPDAIPDSVEYQVRAEEFASPWPFNIGSTSMSFSGLTESNGLVSGDGTDDGGTADGPQNLPAGREAFGIALTLGYQAAGDYQAFSGSLGNNKRFVVWETANGASGNIGIQLRDDNGTKYVVGTSSDFGDGTVRPVVINKPDDNPNNLEVYVGDMSTPKSIDVISDGGYNSANHTSSTNPMGFYAENQSSLSFYADADAGVFEFNADQYSQSEREAFVSRRPEV